MFELIATYLYLVGGISYLMVGLDCGRITFHFSAKSIFAVVFWPILLPYALVKGFLT